MEGFQKIEYSMNGGGGQGQIPFFATKFTIGAKTLRLGAQPLMLSRMTICQLF